LFFKKIWVGFSFAGIPGMVSSLDRLYRVFGYLMRCFYLVVMLWDKLSDKEIKCKPHQLRVLQFDPNVVKDKFTHAPHQRFQNVSILQLFPKNGKICGCGRKSRWATEECQDFAVAVRNIIYGANTTIAWFMRKYYGWRCFECGCEDAGKEAGVYGTISDFQIDHIVPVKLGGRRLLAF
jgi:hypothetical protein